MTTNDNVTPLHTSADEDRNAMAYLTRECEARGWDVHEVLERGFPSASHVCTSCGMALLESSDQLVELDGRTWHSPCRALATRRERDEEATARALSLLPL